MKQTPIESFDLHSFFPYLVRIYYRAVSAAVSQIYGSMYDLSVSEWRVMAVLGPGNIMSASDIVERSSMTRVNVSRAIKSMQKSGLLKRDINGDDKRMAALRLTARGDEVFDALIPLVSQLEKDLLSGLSKEEIHSLISMMEKVRVTGERITQTYIKKSKVIGK